MSAPSPAALGALARRARRLLSPCRLCPRACGVDRRGGERGFCGAGLTLRVAAVSLHRGEEPPLSGTQGSGNIFFSGCNLGCLFCQNYPLSRGGIGRDLSAAALAGRMLSLQERGAHNINLVTPTPWVPQILEALSLARERGLTLPLVYNCGGYERREVLALLDGVVDIYLPDMKYATDRAAWRYSRAPGYRRACGESLAEMLRQVGPLRTGPDGTARRGVLVRHLVLPEAAAETDGVLARLAACRPTPPVSLMFQYFPAYRASRHPLLGRRLWREECLAARAALDRHGLTRGWVQEFD